MHVCMYIYIYICMMYSPQLFWLKPFWLKPFWLKPNRCII